MKIRFLAAIILSTLLAATARAADRYYVGPTGGVWNAAANWSATPGGAGGAGVPAPGDEVFVTNTVATTVNFDATYAASLTGLTLDGVGGQMKIVQSSAASALEVVGIIIGHTGSGRYEQSGGTNVVSLGGGDNPFTLGDQAGSDGTYHMTGGALDCQSTKFVGSLVVGQFGVGAFELAGASASVTTKGITVGYDGVGAIRHTGGALTVATLAGPAYNVLLGYNPGGIGSYVLDNTNGASALTIYGNLIIGYSGTGIFTQYNGAVTIQSAGGDQNTGFMSISGNGGTGTYTIVNGTLNCTTPHGIHVGGYPGNPGNTGTFTINGGVVNANLHVWPNGTLNLNEGVLNGGAYSDGLIDVLGGQFNLNGTINGNGHIHAAAGVTTFADGTAIDISDIAIDGGTATADGNLMVGKGTNSVGIVNIAGGSLTVTNGTFGVGNTGVLTNGTGTGHVNISGGTLTAVTVLLGSSTGGEGDMTVSGTGHVTVTGGLNWNDLIVNAGTVEVIVGPPPPGEDPVLNNAMVGGYLRNGEMDVNGGNVSSPIIKLGVTAGNTGTVMITGGQVDAGVIGVGNNGAITNGEGVGYMTVSNAMVSASTFLLGSSAGGQGELTLRDGGSVASAGTNAIFVCNDFGQIGGDLSWTNVGSAMYCGYAHPGAYVLSNGTSSCQDLYVGYDNAGTMTIAGGAMNILSRLIVGQLGSPLSTGTVWMTGGQLTMTNNDSIIGNSGVGQMTISNGTMTAASVIVGNSSNPGSLTVAGGTMTMLTGLTVGDCVGGMTGIVTITGGALYVTNAAHNAVLDVRGGKFLMSGGTLVADKIVMTNACGLFQRNGGTTSIGSMVLDPNLDADGDGIPNGWEQSHGLDPLNAADASADNDGDGLSNLREYQLGTDPSNASSPFRITAIAREANNIRVTWTTVGGTTNVVQVCPGVAGGNYTNNFSDLSAQLTILGSTVTSTNYLDLNGATNVPARYYRMRLVP